MKTIYIDLSKGTVEDAECIRFSMGKYLDSHEKYKIQGGKAEICTEEKYLGKILCVLDDNTGITEFSVDDRIIKFGTDEFEDYVAKCDEIYS